MKDMSCKVKRSILIAGLTLMVLAGFAMSESHIGNIVRLAASAVWGA